MNTLHVLSQTAVDNTTHALVRALAELRKRGHRVLFATPPGEVGELAGSLKVPVYSYIKLTQRHASPYALWSEARWIAKYCHASPVDIVLAYHAPETWRVALAMAMLGPGRPKFIRAKTDAGAVGESMLGRFLNHAICDHIIEIDTSAQRVPVQSNASSVFSPSILRDDTDTAYANALETICRRVIAGDKTVREPFPLELSLFFK